MGLDEHDNSRARIWRAVAAAVAERVPAHGEARDSSGARASVDAANVLINRIAELDTPVVLILDDVHTLGERSTLSDIAHLIKHAPPQLRLVLATRSDPSIPLGRYRLSGQLVEIRAAELAMTSDETRELLGAVADGLSQAEIEDAVRANGRLGGGAPAGRDLARIDRRIHIVSSRSSPPTTVRSPTTC